MVKFFDKFSALLTIVLLGLTGLGSLIAIWRILSKKTLPQLGRLETSLLVGIIGGLVVITIPLVMVVISSSPRQWSAGKILESEGWLFLYVYLPIVILGTVGTYWQLSWRDRAQRDLRNKLAKKRKESQEENGQ